MTREEAIEILEEVKDLDDSIYQYISAYNEALDMAINSLKQEPCDDTVSRGVFEQVMWERDTAIEQLRELGYELGQKIEPCDDCVSRQALLEFFKDDNYVVNEINNMPSVLPKREHGEWIEHPHECGENWEFSKYECSICHMWEENDSDFCPNCGVEPLDAELIIRG